MSNVAPLKVLVVDDSPLFRHYLSKTFESLPDVEVVGTAVDGDDALRKIRSKNPDLVTLDIDMPGKDGLATLRAIQEEGLITRVVMVSANGGERKTVEALCLGAEDFFLKPSGPEGQSRFRDLLACKILEFRQAPTLRTSRTERAEAARTERTERAEAARTERTERAEVARAESVRSEATTPTTPTKIAIRAPTKPILNGNSTGRGPFHVVVIAVSTGGPNALGEMLPSLPHPLPVPIVIVQHMPPLFTKMLAERLDSKCRATVREAEEGAPFLPGDIYIAPGDYHLTIGGTSLKPVARLNHDPHVNGCRPAADLLFQSAARIFKSGCLAVVMTGMGKDGFEGTRQIVEAGGYALAQDQASCVVWGMPRFVIEAGLAHEVHSLSRLGKGLGDILLRR